MRLIEDSQRIIEKMKLFDKNKGVQIPFKLWPRQVDMLDLLHNYKLVNILKKRQVAGSTLTGADSVVQCMLLDNFTVLALSKTGDDAIEFLRRAKECYMSLPNCCRVPCPLKQDPTLTKMEWVNDSRILSLPANKGAGYTGDRVIIDEAGKITTKTSHITLPEVMMNVYPALQHAGGQLILVGTAEGYGEFHTYYQKGKKQGSGWKSFFFSCFDDPTFTKRQRQQIVMDFGEDHANQEYPRNDTEAWLMSGRCRFNRPALQEVLENDIREGTTGVLSRVGRDHVQFKPEESGFMTQWVEPQRGRKYVIGVDVCQGILASKSDKGSTDSNSIQVIDARTLEQVAEIENKYEPNVLAEEVKRMAQYYNNAFVGVERNIERAVVLELQKIYWNLYYKEEFEDRKQQRTEDIGWYTTAQSKRIMIAHADKTLRENKGIIHSIELLNQMMTFIKLVDGSCEAQEGCHDDHVMAWMIALQMTLCVEIEPVYKEKEKPYLNDGYAEPEVDDYEHNLDMVLSGRSKWDYNNR